MVNELAAKVACVKVSVWVKEPEPLTYSLHSTALLVNSSRMFRSLSLGRRLNITMFAGRVRWSFPPPACEDLRIPLGRLQVFKSSSLQAFKPSSLQVFKSPNTSNQSTLWRFSNTVQCHVDLIAFADLLFIGCASLQQSVIIFLSDSWTESPKRHGDTLHWIQYWVLISDLCFTAVAVVVECYEVSEET